MEVHTSTPLLHVVVVAVRSVPHVSNKSLRDLGPDWNKNFSINQHHEFHFLVKRSYGGSMMRPLVICSLMGCWLYGLRSTKGSICNLPRVWADPAMLYAVHWYHPASLVWASAMYIFEAPWPSYWMLTLSMTPELARVCPSCSYIGIMIIYTQNSKLRLKFTFSHVKSGVGLPTAFTLRLTFSPQSTLTDASFSTKVGGVCTARLWTVRLH